MNSALSKPLEARVMLAVEKHLAVQQQLFYEARILDEERFDEWLSLLTDDIRYRMPVTERRL
ncbi:MAG TPA: aromatic-ring-hydroxylating dioxygenase subunit beta [Rugosibacter sp.]|nr:aromatic-ring-hydroxylating dioxygenase subunit beta [Rugosibacter sp.]